jgi:hypothetical protein
MKEADGIELELLALRLVALDIRQARDPVPQKMRRIVFPDARCNADRVRCGSDGCRA